MAFTKKAQTFGRPSNQRRALLRSLARSLVIHERISTTEAKAKALRPFIERLVTYAKKNTLASRRLTQTRLGDKAAVKKLFDFRPFAIIDRLKLNRPLYLKTAAYGHFGKPGLPWEKVVSM